MYWELSCSLSLGHCCLVKSAPVPCLNLSAGAAVNQRDGIRRQGSSGAASLFSADPVPATESFAVPQSYWQNAWEEYSQKTSSSNQGSTQKYLAFIIWVKSSLSSHCWLWWTRGSFRTVYYCFSPEVRGQIAGLQNCGFSTILRHDTSP